MHTFLESPAPMRKYHVGMLLAGDVGGTKTLLGLFRPGHVRPRLARLRRAARSTFCSLTSQQAFGPLAVFFMCFTPSW